MSQSLSDNVMPHCYWPAAENNSSLLRHSRSDHVSALRDRTNAQTSNEAHTVKAVIPVQVGPTQAAAVGGNGFVLLIIESRCVHSVHSSRPQCQTLAYNVIAVPWRMAHGAAVHTGVHSGV